MTKHEDSAVYVRYKDHIIFKNVVTPIEEAAERETIGWLTKQTDEIMLIEHDRTIPKPQIPSGQGNGVIILKSCIIEIRELPLQKSPDCRLNSTEPLDKASMRFSQRSEKLKT